MRRFSVLYYGLVLQFIFIALQPVAAQSRLNFGLSERQDILPQSRAPLGLPSCKTQKLNTPRLKQLSSNEFRLESGWLLRESYRTNEPGEWYSATVPGTVLTTLVDQGIYPDPYWGLNNMAIPDTLCRMSWVYRYSFETPSAYTGQRATLLFNGINYKAEVWLNNRLLGTINGAFARGRFDITEHLKDNSTNDLVVVIHPPHNPGIPQEANAKEHGPNGGLLCLDGPTFICSEGWDWMPGIRDRNIGIWQDVRLIFSGAVELDDPFVKTDLPLPDTTKVDLSLHTMLINHSNSNEQVRLHLQIADCLDVSTDIDLLPGEHKKLNLSPEQLPQLALKNPRLWWPNGYGSQSLYEMKAILTSVRTGKELDRKIIRFGVRELDYELTAHTSSHETVRILYNPLAACRDSRPVFDNIARRSTPDGYYTAQLLKTVGTSGIKPEVDRDMESFMVVRVNGQRIFCKGGNWGMDDAMKRVSRERLEPYFRLHKEQHFTMIRNWTGESTEEVFYELCDEYGILVFNDFWMSTENYNLAPADNRLFLDNVRETVKRFRNHPSIAIWCPRNEGFAPDALERGIASIILNEDGTRHYLPASIKMNTTNSGPWDYRNPIDFYSFAHGFDTEVGSPSIPPASTIRKMMAVEDTWPIGDAWYYHDYLMGKWGENPFILSYKSAIDRLLGPSDNLDDFCRKAQLVNYDSYRAIFESWNSRLWHNTSGVLLWMSHPAWPSMVWQTYTYDYDTPGAYYGTKKACKPLHIQLNLKTKTVDLVNTSLYVPSKLMVEAEVYSLKGKLVNRQHQSIFNMTSNSRKEVFRLDSAAISGLTDDVYFVKLNLKNTKGHLLDDNTYICSLMADQTLKSINTLSKASLKISVLSHRREGEEMVGRVRVVNESSVPAISVRLSIKDVLPAYFTDGCFMLMPGGGKDLTFHYPINAVSNDIKLLIEGYNVENGQYSIMCD